MLSIKNVYTVISNIEIRYRLSAGALYPMLHNMENDELLIKEASNINGKIRKYYRTADKGKHVLKEAKTKAYELFKEIKD